MGKLNGMLPIEGTLNNLTFYKTKDGLLVRTKGGPSKEQFKHDPNLIRTRENAAEFGENARMGKLLRDAANPMVMMAKDGRVSSRLAGEMSKIKNLDSTSARGQRKVSVGISTAEGRGVLNGFNFNSRSHLTSVLRASYTIDTATGTVTIVGFVPEMNLTYPQYATHVSLRSGLLHLDFATGAYEMTMSHVVNLPIDMHSTDVVLAPAAGTMATGTVFYFLLVEYFQMVNAVEYPLNNGAFNALGIIDVV